MIQADQKAVDEYRARRLKNFAPPERLNLWQWAEKNITISERSSPFPGAYRTSVTPYVREPMEDYTNPWVKFIVLVFPAQSGKTENLILIPQAYDIAQDPAPSIMVLPTHKLARSFSETRLQPMIDDCRQAALAKPKDPDKYKLDEMHFERMTLVLVGSNSPANLAGRPNKKIKADEIDKFPVANDRESDALTLALERFKAFWDRKAILTSTVTTPEGNIWKWWKRSNMKHWLMPCPHCKKKQKLIFGLDQEYREFADVVPRPKGEHENLYRLKWPKDCKISELSDKAWYECIHCHKKIFDHHRQEMLANGEWVSHGDEGEIAGYHINALAVPWITFGDIAAMFLRSKRHPDELQNFFNSWLSIPWDAAEQGTDLIKILDLEKAHEEVPDREIYRKNQCPEDVVFLTAGIDVQEHELWYSVRGWGTEDRSWLISWGKVEVETGDLKAFKQAVDKILSYEYGRPIIMVGMDSGYGKRTPEVYSIVRATKKMVCVKGRRSNITKASDGKDDPVPKPKRIDKYPNGKPIKGGVLHYSPSTSYWKKFFFSRMKSDPPAFFFPDDLDKTYRRHIESEKLVSRKNKAGVVENYYVVRRGYAANHILDCEIINCVMQYVLLQSTTMEKLAMAVQMGLFNSKDDQQPPPKKGGSRGNRNYSL